MLSTCTQACQSGHLNNPVTSQLPALLWSIHYQTTAYIVHHVTHLLKLQPVLGAGRQRHPLYTSVAAPSTVFTPRSHRMHKLISMQTLWCYLQPVWTLPLTIMCSKICYAFCEVLRVLCELGQNRRCILRFSLPSSFGEACFVSRRPPWPPIYELRASAFCVSRTFSAFFSFPHVTLVHRFLVKISALRFLLQKPEKLTSEATKARVSFFQTMHFQTSSCHDRICVYFCLQPHAGEFYFPVEICCVANKVKVVVNLCARRTDWKSEQICIDAFWENSLQTFLGKFASKVVSLGQNTPLVSSPVSSFAMLRKKIV